MVWWKQYASPVCNSLFFFYSLPVNAVTSRCVSHIIHLATKHCINTICPIPASKRNKSTVGAAPMDDDDDDNEPWEAGDLLGKVLALVKQVHVISFNHVPVISFFFTQIQLSPQAMAFLEECCVIENIPYLNLIQWIHTHWGSMYSLTEQVLTLQKVSEITDI